MAKPRAQKPGRTRAARVRLTHFEIQRGSRLCLRIAVADDTLAEVGDELSALIKKIAPATRTPRPVEAPVEEIVSAPQHAGDAVAYHENLRGHLSTLFSSLCDTALADALEIAREERARRAEGSN